jgi:hypothetical protein
MTEISKAHEETTVDAKGRKPTTGLSKTKEAATGPSPSKPYAYYVVAIAIVCVALVFLAVWLFPTPEVFSQSSQVIAVLTATFGVIGTLVGAYFGIKSTGDARDTVERVHEAQLSQQSSQRLDDSRSPGNGRLNDVTARNRASQLDD